MRIATVVAVLICLAARFGQCAPLIKASVQTFIPFSTKGVDGRLYTLKSVSAGKPVLFVFLQDDDAIKKGVQDMNRLSRLLKGRVRVVGLYVDDQPEAKQFVKSNKVHFLVLCNCNHILDWLGNKSGIAILTNALVLPNGKVLDKSFGYNRSSLRRMMVKLRATGRAVHLSTSRFPKKLVIGQNVDFGLIPPQ